GARFTVLMVGIFLVLFGGYMLWTNFLSPNRKKNIESGDHRRLIQAAVLNFGETASNLVNVR
ncbi:MAG: hypothetical protein WAU99_10720, partial [Pseudolabrys sp.]